MLRWTSFFLTVVGRTIVSSVFSPDVPTYIIQANVAAQPTPPVCRPSLRAEPEPKRRLFQYSAHSLQGKVLLQPNGTDENVHSEGCFFVGSHNPPDVKNPKWGTPNSQKLALHKFILAILSDVEKSAKASGMIIFRIRAKMGEISPENFAAWPSRIDARRQCSL